MASHTAVNDQVISTDMGVVNRPWTAEIDTHLGHKPKYNLSLQDDGGAPTHSQLLRLGATGSSPSKSTSTKALKEKWAQENTPASPEKASAEPERRPNRSPSGSTTFLQGFHVTRHPKFGDTSD